MRAIAAYSTRARPGAPVSVPVWWEDLRPSLNPAALTMTAVLTRLARGFKDPWKNYWSCKQRLTAQRVRAIARL